MGVELDVPILEAQAEQIECNDVFAAARGGNRAGKSIGFGYWLYLQRLQEYPLAVHAVAGADYSNLRRGFFPLMCGVLESLGWEDGTDFKYIESGAPRLFLPFLHPKAKLHSLSVKLVDRIKGASIQTLVLEEPQSWDTRERSGKRLYEILVTRLSHSQVTRRLYPDLVPMLRMSFNPMSEGSWLHELVENQWKKSGYKCWRMSVRDNVLLLGREQYIKNLEDNIEPRRQPAEIDGHWSTGGGGAYYAFNSTVHGHPPAGIPDVDAIDEAEPLLWTHDFGTRQVASIVCQRYDQPKTFVPAENPEDKPTHTIPVPVWQPTIIRVLDEFVLENGNTELMLERFLNSRWLEVAKRVGVHLYGDPSGGTPANTAWARGAARTPWEILKRGLLAEGINVSLKYAGVDPGQKNRVYAVNDQFNGGGKPGVTVNLERAPILVRDWREVEWDKSGMKLVKTDELSHTSDAFAYLAYSVRSRMNSMWSYAIAKNR